LAYLTLLLAEHPDIQDRVVAEINEHYPSFDEPLTTEILNCLTYMEMVIKETLRLVPIGPLIAREVKNDLQLENCTLKPGMLMMINIYSLHRRKDIWGDDADKFNPDRFLQENVRKRHPYSFIPFSAGARNCVGICRLHFKMVYIV
jgi:cytochrome P450